MKPAVSIIVECANVRLAGEPRARMMLRALAREARACPKRLEILVCYEAGSEPDLRLEECGLPPVWHPVGAPGGEYYELKNRGAVAARGDIVVFVDSDVIPQRGWLDALLARFADPDVECVAGSAFIDAGDWYESAFALFWLFPLRSADAAVRPANRFWANNLAFRRSAFLAHPFPCIEGTSRGSCLALAGRLREAGITIWEARGARVSHPAPRKGRHFVWRALAQGRDRILRAPAWRRTPPESLFWFAARTGRGCSRILFLGSRVGLPLWGAPYAAGVCLAYYGLMLTGELAAFFRVPAIRRVAV